MSVMAAEPRTSAVQVVGTGGEIVLGKEYAGRAVSVVMIEPDIWSVKVGTFVPDNERWLLDPEVQATLDRALERLQNRPYEETNLDELEERILSGYRPDSSGSE